MNLGYACINLTLSKNSPKITTNRGMVKRTFLNKGLKYVEELVHHKETACQLAQHQKTSKQMLYEKLQRHAPNCGSRLSLNNATRNH